MVEDVLTLYDLVDVVAVSMTSAIRTALCALGLLSSSADQAAPCPPDASHQSAHESADHVALVRFGITMRWMT